MQFLHPIWLFAMAAVAIPILIHLWNVRKSRTRLVGSVAFFDQAAEKKSWQKRISDPLLLLVRCLLIVALSLLLAKPFFKSANQGGRVKGWVLLGKEDLPKIYAAYQPIIDSLVKMGYETRYFAVDFPLLKLDEALKSPSDSTAPGSYWAVAATLSKHGNLPVQVFTNNKLKNFSGPRPQNDSFQWHVLHSKDSSEWISRARSIAVDTSTLKITIVGEAGKMDAAYVRSALNAISQYGKRRMNIAVSNDLNGKYSDQDWVFWLSQQWPSQRPATKNFFYYDTGKIQNLSAIIITETETSTPIHLYQAFKTTSQFNGRVLWTDGFGHPVLQLKNLNGAKDLSFSSRIDPAFNDLPWNSAFPQFIYQLLFGKEDEPLLAQDQRVMDPKQLQLNKAEPKEAGMYFAADQPDDLSKYLWLLVFILFLVERILSFVKQKNKVHGS